MKKPAIRIGLFGLFGIGNLGNDASLIAMRQKLRRCLPEAEICCIGPQPESVRVAQDLPAYSIYMVSDRVLRSRWSPARFVWKLAREIVSWARILCWLRKVDVMVVPGTGILDDFGEGPLGIPYQLFKWVLAARIRDVPWIFISIGAGPILNPVSRWLMKRAAAMATYRSYRDDLSKEFMKSIGLSTTLDPVYPDLVFGLDSPQELVNLHGGADRVTVGVGVMSYYGWQCSADRGAAIYGAYVEKTSLFISHLVRQRFRVRLLIGDTTYDEPAVEDVLDRVRAEGVDPADSGVIYDRIRSFEDLLREIGRCDIVVASRFHNIVAALMLAKPVVSFGYARKNEALLREMGLEGFSQHMEQLDVDRLLAQVDRLLERRDDVTRRLQQKSKEYRGRLATQYKYLFERIAGLVEPLGEGVEVQSQVPRNAGAV